jgi:hypothetical protein
MHNKELSDELMRTYPSRNFKTGALDSTHHNTHLHNTQDEPTLAQNYVHHHEAELVERDQQLEASQALAEELQDVVHHMQGLLPQDEEPEEDPELAEGSSGVEDN